MGEKDITAMRSEAGAGGRATMGKTELKGQDVELCLGIQLRMRGCKMNGNFQGLKEVKYNQGENHCAEHYNNKRLR